MFSESLLKLVFEELVKQDEILKAKNFLEGCVPFNLIHGKVHKECADKLQELLNFDYRNCEENIFMKPDRAYGIMRFKVIKDEMDKIGGINRVYSYGCGEGTFERRLALDGLSVTCFHATQKVCDEINGLEEKSDYKGTLWVTPDIEAIEKSAPYDVAFCLEVFEHCTDEELVKLAAHLKKCARKIFISVPFGANTLMPPCSNPGIKDIDIWERKGPIGHIRAFKMENFTIVLEKLFPKVQKTLFVSDRFPANQIIAYLDLDIAQTEDLEGKEDTQHESSIEKTSA